MKANEVPEKLYVNSNDHLTYNGYYAFTNKMRACDIEYTRTDAFIENARKWFEKQPETYDANGVRCYGTEDFEDFVNYMKRG